jgi:hypothetical protein
MAAQFLAVACAVYGEEKSREHALHLVDDGLVWCDSPQPAGDRKETP